MEKLTIDAYGRTVTGKKVKALRRKGLLPANLYGHNVPSQSLQVDTTTFMRLQPHLSATSLLTLKVDGKAESLVMIHRVQHDSLTRRPKHIEFFQVNAAERLTASVPLVLTGVPEAARNNDGFVLLHELASLEVTCLPGDLPSAIEVPCVTLVEAGDAIFVRDLAIDRSKITVRADGATMIVSLATSQIAPEDQVAPAAESAPSEAEAASES